jgi:hypothetical protein
LCATAIIYGVRLRSPDTATLCIVLISTIKRRLLVRSLTGSKKKTEPTEETTILWTNGLADQRTRLERLIRPNSGVTKLWPLATRTVSIPSGKRGQVWGIDRGGWEDGRHLEGILPCYCRIQVAVMPHHSACKPNAKTCIGI